MPNTQSAKKALRRSDRRHERSLNKTRAWKTAAKKFKTAAASGNDDAKDLLQIAYKKIDKAAKANAMKKNKAARLKSRLTKKLTAPK